MTLTPVIEGHHKKGGQNRPTPSTLRPAPPKGSGMTQAQEQQHEGYFPTVEHSQCAKAANELRRAIERVQHFLDDASTGPLMRGCLVAQHHVYCEADNLAAAHAAEALMHGSRPDNMEGRFGP